MQRRKSVVFGILCGIACALCVAMYAQQLQADADAQRAEALARYGGEQTEVWVATRDIAPGETVDETNAEYRMWLVELLPHDAVSDLAGLESRVATSPIVQGEVISAQRFVADDEALGTPVPEGLCAVSVPAEDVATVGGSIRAGSRVDVYVSSGTTTDLLAHDVLVLFTSASSADGSEAISWATLAVEPEMVQELISAAERTSLYFSLPSDSVLADGSYATESEKGEADGPQEAEPEPEVEAKSDEGEPDASADTAFDEGPSTESKSQEEEVL
ncbi:Flp pilus assembly protein CpaB [Slackia heliotrinireducens]|uniref:Flp pilus assembly protein CpaB n=1 Tax=Slackia heliotrinireducens (strain ATCC 29202 / DSM 20476 / NCTC 11029 / RHS 1) TaxID=471855 RepID=C7N841_SLAHD|nr:Flp pilus assembly protein CpaB [Slackia heliotrinireducens]ACV23076.1 Flp pilus assembly protein CpaB [Slackia heliotrinireducens DSM 20476]VEH02045.1 Flp pilus assembly protein CpaB [Slackia heliotrinireducens]